MADKTIKHFVIVRFFERKVTGYIHDIFDLNFVSERVLLAKNNLLKSLENQTNKNFDIIFLVNDKYLSDEKYRFILNELQDVITISLRFMKSTEVRELIKDACNNYDFVIQSKIDYDDFVYKNAVAETQSKIAECDSVLAYGYCKGYVYFNGEVYPFYDLYKQLGMAHSAVFQSLILKSEFASKLPYMNLYGFIHNRIKVQLKDFLEKNNIIFSENMFQQNDFDNAIIFFRHDATETNKGKPYTKDNVPGRVRGKKLLTTEETGITKQYLEDEFGFFYDLNSIK